MKRERPEAAGDRADQSGCCDQSQRNGKARALPASDEQPVNHNGSAAAEEAALHVARTPGARDAAALPPPMTAAEACLFPFHLVLAACGLFMVVSVLRAEGVDEIVNAYVYCLGMWCTFSSFVYFYTRSRARRRLCVTEQERKTSRWPAPMASRSRILRQRGDDALLGVARQGKKDGDCVVCIGRAGESGSGE